MKETQILLIVTFGSSKKENNLNKEGYGGKREREGKYRENGRGYKK